MYWEFATLDSIQPYLNKRVDSIFSKYIILKASIIGDVSTFLMASLVCFDSNVEYLSRNLMFQRTCFEKVKDLPLVHNSCSQKSQREIIFTWCWWLSLSATLKQ